MSPVIFLFVGLLLVWLVFTGRAKATWDAITASSPVAWTPSGSGAAV
jgi:hypothetical protein